MDNFDMAMALIKEAKEERERRIRYEKELEKVGYDWEARLKIYERYTPKPVESVVKDNLKMARRLLKKEYV